MKVAATLFTLSLFATACSAVLDYHVQNPVSAKRKAELTAAVKTKVKGIALPLLTLYDNHNQVDHAAMAAYMKQMIKDGIVEGKGFVLTAASGGDFPVLSVAERKAIAKTVVDAANGTVPIFLSVQESHLDVVIELAQYAESIGCYGIQVSVPYYWTTTDGDAVRWFEAVHNATKNVVIIFYNTPWEAYDAPIEVLQEVGKLERVRALKYFTTRDPMTFRWNQALVALRDDFSIIDNTVNPVPAFMLGANAFITHLASVWPANQLDFYSKIEAGDYGTAMQMYEKAQMPWYAFRIEMGAYTSGEAPPVKKSLELTGRSKNAGPMRAPSRPLTPEQTERLRKLLIEMGVPNVQPVPTMVEKDSL